VQKVILEIATAISEIGLLSNQTPCSCTTKVGLKPLNVWRSRKRKTLGIWSRPDGLMIDEVNAPKNKALKWADAVQTERLDPTEATTTPMENPLAATSRP